MIIVINAYIILYQYFDSLEISLSDQIDSLQKRVLYREYRKILVEEIHDLELLKVKLDFVQKIEKELLKLFLE